MPRLPRLTTTKLATVLIAAVLVVVPFHAFLTIWLSTAVGHFVWLRLWDEALLSILAILAVVWLIRDARLRANLRASLVVRLMVAYAALTIVLGAVALVHQQVSPMALLYAFIINLRFLVWFVVVWLAAQRSEWLRTHWQRLAFWPLGVVVAFALLQFFVLPHNFLSHFGYGPQTYVPYITINQDDPTIRVQSFLRGANPLGAYLAALLPLVAASLVLTRRQWSKWLLAMGAALALGATFSRSGWIGATIGLVAVLFWRAESRLQRLRIGIGLGAILLALLAGLVTLHSNVAVQDAVFHVSSESTALVTSNEGHVASLTESTQTILANPLGFGPGAAGQASWYNAGHPIRNTESYYLQLGEEVGVVGLLLFMVLLVAVGYELWCRRSDWLALGLLAGLLGLAVVAQIAYAWTDDTLAYVWWGLAGIALARPVVDAARPKR